MNPVLIPATLAAVYQAEALLAALLHLAAKEPRASYFPPISILKPVRGLDPHFYEAIRSHAAQDYPDFEILFGVSDPSDAAIPDIRRLIADFPHRGIRIIPSSTRTPNGKVGVLIDLARQARFPLLLVNDSDILVPDDYLRRIVAPLENPGVGLVTCVYGASSDHWAGRWEALGIATDFTPSLLAAPLFGVRGFGLGATLLFRAEELRASGGFERLADYIADDYQLGQIFFKRGHKVVLSKVAVETFLPGERWGEVWRHQVRWARTIRVTRGAGYAGLPLTNASLWALAALATGAWRAGLLVLALRMLTGLVVGVGVLGRRELLKYSYLMPLRDLWGAAVWLWGLFGNTVEWRGTRLRLSADGRVHRIETLPEAYPLLK